MANTIQLKRGTAAAWTSNNPTLAVGEAGYETDTGKLKIGDGSTAWTSLGYFAGGSTTPTSDTGTTITFTADTLWNEATYLTSGALTLDLTDAVKGTYAVVYCDSYTPAISGETYYINSGSFNASALNILSFFYDGTQILLNIGNVTYLAAPTLSLTAGNESIDVSWSSISNADTYLVQRDTDSGFGSPTTAYNSTGTSFTDSGLTGGTTYYYRAYAVGNGYLTSDWSSTANASPYNFSTSLVASWRLSANANDYTTNHNLTPTDITYGGSDYAIFNGSTSTATTADSDDFSFSDGGGDLPFTISFWYYANNNTGTKMVIQKDDASSQREWSLYHGSSALTFSLFTDGSNYLRINKTISVTTWYNITITYDGSETAGGINLYVNGALDGASASQTGTYTGMANSTAPIYMGSRNGSSLFLSGRVKYAHIWKDRELTSDEISSMYSIENGGGNLFS